MEFNWYFTEYDYNKYIEENTYDYLGCVRIGDICIDLLNREDGVIDYDFYVAHEDTGYGYKNDILPYDYADGGGINVNCDMSYEEFVYKAMEVFENYIKNYDKCFGYSLVEHANRPLEVW